MDQQGIVDLVRNPEIILVNTDNQRKWLIVFV